MNDTFYIVQLHLVLSNSVMDKCVFSYDYQDSAIIIPTENALFK